MTTAKGSIREIVSVSDRWPAATFSGQNAPPSRHTARESAGIMGPFFIITTRRWPREKPASFSFCSQSSTRRRKSAPVRHVPSHQMQGSSLCASMLAPMSCSSLSDITVLLYTLIFIGLTPGLLPLVLAQHPTQHLPRAGQGQCVHKLHVPRDLVV